MFTVSERGPVTIVEDDMVIGAFGGIALGNVDPRFSPEDEVLANRQTALAHLLGGQSVDNFVLITMDPTGLHGFVDLDIDGHDVDLVTDGLVTNENNRVLSGNPADCEMIAMYGYAEASVTLGVFHISRRIADEGGHLDALHHMREMRGIPIEAMRMIFGPSIRADSYKFGEISPEQKEDPKWIEFIEQRANGEWHVDVHGKVKAELVAAGVPEAHMYIPDVDVGADTAYFSHRQYIENQQQRGRNAVMIAIK